MKHIIILAALLASSSAMAQNGSQQGQHNSATHAAPTPYEADVSTCSHNGGPEYPCHICQRGPWYDIKEYECTVEEEARQDRERARR